MTGIAHTVASQHLNRWNATLRTNFGDAPAAATAAFGPAPFAAASDTG